MKKKSSLNRKMEKYLFNLNDLLFIIKTKNNMLLKLSKFFVFLDLTQFFFFKNSLL